MDQYVRLIVNAKVEKVFANMLLLFAYSSM